MAIATGPGPVRLSQSGRCLAAGGVPRRLRTGAGGAGGGAGGADRLTGRRLGGGAAGAERARGGGLLAGGAGALPLSDRAGAARAGGLGAAGAGTAAEPGSVGGAGRTGGRRVLRRLEAAGRSAPPREDGERPAGGV
ncbi:MAG: hypothetical protein FJX77_11950 [Armatimonadetes bacterium]|nr:hypothetical protein [Armatimonadota bacterium]